MQTDGGQLGPDLWFFCQLGSFGVARWVSFGAVLKTIRLDLDVLSWLMQQGEARGIPYQTLLNSLLKERMRETSLKRDTFRNEIRKIVREELRKAS